MRNIGFALSQKMLPLCIFLCIYIPQTRSTKYCKIQGSTLGHVRINNVQFFKRNRNFSHDIIGISLCRLSIRSYNVQSFTSSSLSIHNERPSFMS